MKKEKDTWLSFFKRTLKIIGIIGLLFILGIAGLIIYWIINPQKDGRTYLNCEKTYYAFTEAEYNNSGWLYFRWDSVEQKFKSSTKIKKIDKQTITEEFDLEDSEPDKPAIMTFDRVKGTMVFKKSETSETLFEYNCQKITRKLLPKKEIKQKF